MTYPRFSRTRSVLFSTACAALLAGPALAAPGAQGCGHPGILSVTGHGESRVAPDQMLISLGVTTQAETAAQAMDDNSSRQASILQTLRDAGVAEGDIQTEGLTLNPTMNYPEDGGAPSISGYMAQNLLTVRVTDIARAGAVLDSIVDAGANEMRGIRFIREDSQGTQDQALSDAVADATHRAGVMAEAAGLELGRVMRIGEPQSRVIAPEPMQMRAMAASGQADSIPVEGGEIAFTAAVEVAFSLGGGDENCAMPMEAPAVAPGGQAAPPASPAPTPGQSADSAPEGEPQPALRGGDQPPMPRPTRDAPETAPGASETVTGTAPEADDESTTPAQGAVPADGETAPAAAPDSNDAAQTGAVGDTTAEENATAAADEAAETSTGADAAATTN